MEPRRTLGCEALRQLDRVAALERHGLPPAAGESDDAPFEDVDGRDHLELVAC
jgi:hypothetical protein